MHESGVEKEEIRVRFGTGETQTVPLAWAETMLNLAYEAEKSNAKPRRFSELLTESAMKAR